MTRFNKFFEQNVTSRSGNNVVGGVTVLLLNKRTFLREVRRRISRRLSVESLPLVIFVDPHRILAGLKPTSSIEFPMISVQNYDMALSIALTFLIYRPKAGALLY